MNLDYNLYPLIGTKNKQVKQQLSKTIKEQYGHCHLFQNQRRLLNPYSTAMVTFNYRLFLYPLNTKAL